MGTRIGFRPRCRASIWQDPSEENEAEAIEAGDAAMEAPAINQRAGDRSDRQGDRDIQIKKVTPAEFVARAGCYSSCEISV